MSRNSKFIFIFEIALAKRKMSNCGFKSIFGEYTDPLTWTLVCDTLALAAATVYDTE